MFSLDEVQTIIDYLELLGMNLNIDIIGDRYKLGIERRVNPDEDYSVKEEELQNQIDCLRELEAFIKMIRGRYYSWLRYLDSDTLPF